jgi:hypothetical protein
MEDKDAELSLLRSRFNLRLDAERVRTQDATAALRAACQEATRSQQEAAVAELASMRQRFEETTALQRSALELALSEERMRAAEAQSACVAEAALLRRTVLGLESELHDAQENALKVQRDAAAEMMTEKQRHRVDAEEIEAAFSKQREVLAEEVVARFELEHFRLTTTLAAEVSQRKRAEEDAADLRARLKAMQHSLSESLGQIEPKAEKQPEFISRSTQTTNVDNDRPLCSPRLLDMMLMRLSDAEGEMWRASGAEVERLEVVSDRLRRAVALKNDTIDELKDELWRREREILETRGILAGLGQKTGPHS